MELNLSTQTVSLSEVIYEGVCEQPLECDVLLPDCCPDIQKILRCEVVPTLLSSTVSGDKLTVDGIAMAHIYYLDEVGCIRHAEYKIPYTKVVELRSAVMCPTVNVTQNVDYFNCRAVSPRRLDMRGAVSLCVRVTGQSEEQVVCGAQGAGMQLRRDVTENVCILPQATRQMSLREEVELGYGKPAVGNIIRYSAAAEVSDFKVIEGKLITKGELTVKLIYQCEDEPKKLETMEYALPLSQIIDIEGVDEDCMCNVWYDICTIEVTPKSADDGECRILVIEMTANACAVAHRRVELQAACDCYSTMYECRQAVKQMPMLRLLSVAEECCMWKETLELPSQASAIIDLWCAAGAVNVKYERDSAVISGKLTVCMFVYEEDGAIAYYDQAREFSHRIETGEAENLQFAPRVRVAAAAFSLSGHENFEVRCNIKICGCIYSQQRKKVICDLSVDESREKTRRENVLYLYYASEREPVWEIAKRYNTSVEAVQSGNQLEDSAMSGKTMLLIPMK